MEVYCANDIFQPLPIEKWILLKNSLKRDWPSYAYYYSFLNNAIKWKKKDPQFKLQIYCPNGDVNSGTFIAISTHSWCIVYIFTFKESKNLLRRILEETKMINWNEYLEFAAVHSDFSDVVEEFIDNQAKNKTFVLAGKDMTYNYFKPKEECLHTEVLIPDELELRYLNETHIPLIHSLWPHRSKEEPEKSSEYLASLVKLNKGIGLFMKNDNTLVSWILNCDWGGLGMLQTVEEHKRKGYAKLVVKAMAKELAKSDNLDSIAFVVDEKIAPKKLFESLGFKRLKTATWYYIKPTRS